MRNKTIVIALIAIGIFLLVWLGYMIFSKRMVSLPTRYFGTPSTPSKAPDQPPDHIVIIVNENKAPASIIDNPSAPFINTLMHEYATAKNYHAVTNPGLPNYLAMTSGTTAGITSDCNPLTPTCQANVLPVTSAIERSGRTWKVYAEGMTAPCGRVSNSDYLVTHNPFVYYPSITSNQQYCSQRIVPLSELNKDLSNTNTLPNFVFIIPDTCNSGHNCPVERNDTWLSQKVSAILAAPAFTEQRSLLVITWDEGTADNQVPLIFAGSMVKRGYRSENYYTHYSLLRTVEALWQLPSLAEEDETASLMYDMFR